MEQNKPKAKERVVHWVRTQKHYAKTYFKNGIKLECDSKEAKKIEND